MRKNHIVLAVAVIISAMLACNLPSNNSNQQNPSAILTAAALTVQAQLATSAPTISPATLPRPLHQPARQHLHQFRYQRPLQYPLLPLQQAAIKRYLLRT